MDATLRVDATSVVVSPRYMKEPVVKSDENWETAYHGTWWYSVWLVLQSGVFLESNDRDKGGWVFYSATVFCCCPNGLCRCDWRLEEGGRMKEI